MLGGKLATSPASATAKPMSTPFRGTSAESSMPRSPGSVASSAAAASVAAMDEKLLQVLLGDFAGSEDTNETESTAGLSREALREKVLSLEELLRAKDQEIEVLMSELESTKNTLELSQGEVLRLTEAVVAKGDE
ncbi:unnamed protein product, partial [Symbiodinium sp. KB8]